jgi:hypothetical protein
MQNNEKVLGLIAGQGRLPLLVVEGAKKSGLKVICAGLADNAGDELRDLVDEFYSVPLARPGSWIRKLRKHKVTDTVMVGRVAKKRIYTPFRILRYLPDWRAFRIWYFRLRKQDKKNDTLLGALADELKTGGIILQDSTKYCKDQLADKGVMTQIKPSKSVSEDIEFGLPMAAKIAALDIGQAITVREREVIAVEAIEGTARLIERTGQYCKKGGWALIKVAKPNQDMRFDVPCIGTDTVKSLSENNAKAIAVQSGKTIIIDKQETIRLADKLGISIIGIEI